MDAESDEGELVRLSRPEYIWREDGKSLKRLTEEALPVAEQLRVDRGRTLSGNYRWVKPDGSVKQGYWLRDETNSSPTDFELVWVCSIPANKKLGGGWINSKAL